MTYPVGEFSRLEDHEGHLLLFQPLQRLDAEHRVVANVWDMDEQVAYERVTIRPVILRQALKASSPYVVGRLERTKSALGAWVLGEANAEELRRAHELIL